MIHTEFPAVILAEIPVRDRVPVEKESTEQATEQEKIDRTKSKDKNELDEMAPCIYNKAPG